jgi:hypothetical protein
VDDPLHISFGLPEGVNQESTEDHAEPASEPDPLLLSTPELSAQAISVNSAPELRAPSSRTIPVQDHASRLRGFRHNLFLLLALSLAAFVLTAWILVRADSPFGIFSTGPQEIVRAQLLAVGNGQFRPAYDMFSARYRQQVSFDLWHQLVVTHWRMFHADVVSSGELARTGHGVTLVIHLRDEDDTEYRARFTLIRLEGHWWIDDVHWSQDASGRDISRT